MFGFLEIEPTLASCMARCKPQYWELKDGGAHTLLGGSWDLVSKVIGALIGVISK